MGEKIKWLWKETSTEEHYRPFTTCYCLILATCKPLQEEHLTQTFSHLFKKVPSLRVCFGDRDGKRWLKEMPQEILDFELVSNATTEELHKKMQQYNFNMETGPLWCVKLQQSEMECRPPSYPCVYNVFLGIHHSITDGVSNTKICGFIANILNDVITGEIINDNDQLGVFISDEKTQALIQEQVTILEANPELPLRLKVDYEAYQSKHPLFKSTYKDREQRKAETKMITRDLDSALTSSFVNRCRAESVSVHSAFTALVNIAMVDLLMDGGLLQDTYDIHSNHALNVRRYWEGNASQFLGCHILTMAKFIKTPHNASENFWKYARLANEQLQKDIQSGKVLQNQAAKHCFPALHTNLGINPYTDFDFYISNLGDVTGLLTEGGQNVRVINILRSLNASSSPVTCSCLIHTFCGRLSFTLLYNDLVMRQELAKKIYEKILYYLERNI